MKVIVIVDNKKTTITPIKDKSPQIPTSRKISVAHIRMLAV